MVEKINLDEEFGGWLTIDICKINKIVERIKRLKEYEICKKEEALEKDKYDYVYIVRDEDAYWYFNVKYGEDKVIVNFLDYANAEIIVSEFTCILRLWDSINDSELIYYKDISTSKVTIINKKNKEIEIDDLAVTFLSILLV